MAEVSQPFRQLAQAEGREAVRLPQRGGDLGGVLVAGYPCLGDAAGRPERSCAGDITTQPATLSPANIETSLTWRPPNDACDTYRPAGGYQHFRASGQ